jgi:UDP-N-acetylglucosamine 2-epimerase (non-hydrolysing)
MTAVEEIAANLPVIFPVHPRTRQRLQNLPAIPAQPALRFIEPLGYLDFLALQRRAAVVITDSGGIQEETTFLGVPCLTLRKNTERPVTVTLGTNVLIGQDPERLPQEVARMLMGSAHPGTLPPLWDGRASERIAAVVLAQAWKSSEGGSQKSEIRSQKSE